MTYPDPNQPPRPMPPNGTHGQPMPAPRPMPPAMPPPGAPYQPMHPEAAEFYRRQSELARARRRRWLWFRIVCAAILAVLLFGGVFWNAIHG